MGVVCAAFGLCAGTLTEMGARVGVGPAIWVARTNSPTSAGATCELAPFTGANGSYVGYKLEGPLVEQEETNKVISRKKTVKRCDAEVDMRWILPK